MANSQLPLLTTLKCAIIAAGLLSLGGCWDKVPYTGPLAGEVGAATPKKNLDRVIPSPETEITAPPFSDSSSDPISDPFLDEDIFANTSSMFGTEPLETTPLETVAAKPEAGNSPLLSSDESDADKEQVPTPRLSQNARQLVWKLGCNLSMAAIHVPPTDSSMNESTPLEESKLAATELMIVLPELQEDPFANVTELTAPEALEALLPMGRRLGKQIFAEYDREHVALFEVGFKSSILLVLYSPESPMNNAMVSTLESGAAKAKLPPRLWQPLVDAIKKQQPRETVEQRVFEFHEAVAHFLAD